MVCVTTSIRLTIPEFAPTEAIRCQSATPEYFAASRFLNSRRLKLQGLHQVSSVRFDPPHDS